MTDGPTPLTWETSNSSTNRSTSDQLPDEVITCLKNARFLHLATCTDNVPHVSLMNYTYLPPHSRPINVDGASSRLPSGPTIIMTSNPSSKKASNLLTNPNVSLLVHDWVSSQPRNLASDGGRERSPAGAGRSSSLASMLMQMNSAEVSSISATINGHARVLEPGTEEERWCKEQHLANNTFNDGDAAQNRPVHPRQSQRPGDGGRECYIEDEEVRVVVVQIRDGRISDWKGGVKDWVLSGHSREEETWHGNGRMVNGD